MKPVFLVVALATAIPFTSGASEPRPTQVAQPDAPVPPLQYRSVFADTPTGVEDRPTDWKAANAEVAQFPRGHIDLLKWEEAQEGRASAGEQPAAPSAPLAPPSPSAPSSASPQGQPDHHGH